MVVAFLLGLLAGTALGVSLYPLLIAWVAAREHEAASAEAEGTPRAPRAVLPPAPPPPPAQPRRPTAS